MANEAQKYSGSDKMLSVTKPIQFFAFAWGTTVALLATAMWNDPFQKTLGRDGMLLFSGTFAAVLLAVLGLFTLILYKHGEALGTDSRPDPPPGLSETREPAGKIPEAVVAAGDTSA
jgi:hypothetical protein